MVRGPSCELTERAERQLKRCEWLRSFQHVEAYSCGALITFLFLAWGQPELRHSGISSILAWLILYALRMMFQGRAAAEHRRLQHLLKEEMRRDGFQPPP